MAFKLAELFVEIKGDESPINKVVNTLKGSLPGVASKLGSTFSSAFTVALGPIGFVFKAIEGLFGLIDEGNEDVAKLGEYFTEAIAPIKALVTGLVGNLNDWITKLVETVKASDTVQAAFAKATEYMEAGIENVKIAIDQGLAVFEQLKAIAIETFNGATILATQFYESIMKAFGSEVVASTVSVGESIQTWVVDKLELAGIFVRNWPTFWEIAVLQIKTLITNIGETMATIPANAAIVGEYIANNWVKLFADAGNAIGTILINIGKNIADLASAFIAFIKDPSGGFKFDFKPLLEGFKATADKFPELIKPSLTSAEKELQALYDKIGAQEAKGFEKHKPKKGEEAKAATAEEAAKQSDKFKSQSFGAADFAANLRRSIFSDKDDTPAKTLKATERVAKASEDTLAEVKKPKPTVLG